MSRFRPNPAYRTVDALEFLDMDFGDAKAELVDGAISVLAAGSPRHAAINVNLLCALTDRLRGSGCRPYGSDMPLRTARETIRFPDVTVYCNDPASPANDGKRLLDHPRVIFEVLSPSTASNDQVAKLAEYLALDSVAAVVFVDPDGERVRLVGSDGTGDWLPQESDLTLDALGIIMPRGEIFARD